MRWHEFIPLNEYDQYVLLALAVQAHQSVTEHAVETVLLSLSIKELAGLDTLSSGAVCLLMKWD